MRQQKVNERGPNNKDAACGVKAWLGGEVYITEGITLISTHKRYVVVNSTTSDLRHDDPGERSYK